MAERPSQNEIEAAARVLDSEGALHQWWPKTTPRYENLDSIGKNEFEAIVERMLIAANKARRTL